MKAAEIIEIFEKEIEIEKEIKNLEFCFCEECEHTIKVLKKLKKNASNELDRRILQEIIEITTS